MANNEFYEETLQYFVNRVVDNAKHAKEESKGKELDAYTKGRLMTYYEVLDSLKNDLEIREMDLDAFGLNFEPQDLLFA